MFLDAGRGQWPSTVEVRGHLGTVPYSPPPARAPRAQLVRIKGDPPLRPASLAHLVHIGSEGWGTRDAAKGQVASVLGGWVVVIETAAER